MILILLGPPGAGKGTQAKLLSRDLQVPHISTGDMFRDHKARGTELGKKVDAIMASGGLVPDDVTNDMVKERLSRLYRKKEWLAHLDMLKAHYRMHDSIAALVAPYYQDQLYSSTAAQKADLEINELVADFDSRLIWIECPVSEEDYFDTRQVSLIRQIVQRFATANELQDPESDLGIVAPYRAMIHALKKEVKDHTIDTVERFQGSERKIIILCLPFRKAKSLKHMQALSEDGIVDRKLIVAVSRAKERLIILGNSDLCRQARHYKELIKHIQNYGKIINYQELGVQNG